MNGLKSIPNWILWTAALLAAALVSAVTSAYAHESFADVIIILLVVIINAVLGVYQESKAEQAIAALKAAGVMVHRHTLKNDAPRGIFCAIGRCTDCVMIVDGQPNVRTCVTPLHAGMKVQTQYGVSAKE